MKALRKQVIFNREDRKIERDLIVSHARKTKMVAVGKICMEAILFVIFIGGIFTLLSL